MVPVFYESITNNYSWYYWLRLDKYQYSNGNSFIEQNSSLNNQVYNKISPNYVPQKEKGEEL